MELGKTELLKAYPTMKVIREFEERLHFEFATGEIPGFVRLYACEESVAAGVCMHLDDRDKVTSTHHNAASRDSLSAWLFEIASRNCSPMRPGTLLTLTFREEN
jgi:hypothetical protein